jgi:tRNA C32,U32 (ribose-2'-O)-methylase TrmJ
MPIKKALDPDPRNDDPDDVRRIAQQRDRRLAADESDQDPTELVDAADRGARVVDRGRDRLERDPDDPKLDVLPIATLRRSEYPFTLVLGNEEEGLRPAILKVCYEIVTIPGSGSVQSLNVPARAAILIFSMAPELDPG